MSARNANGKLQVRYHTLSDINRSDVPTGSEAGFVPPGQLNFFTMRGEVHYMEVFKNIFEVQGHIEHDNVMMATPHNTMEKKWRSLPPRFVFHIALLCSQVRCHAAAGGFFAALTQLAPLTSERGLGVPLRCGAGLPRR